MNEDEARIWAELAELERQESPDGKTGFDRLLEDRIESAREIRDAAFNRLVGGNEDLVLDLLRRNIRARSLLPTETRPPAPVPGTRTYEADVARLGDWAVEHGAYTYAMAARDYQAATGIRTGPSFWGYARRHYDDRLGEL